jgi:single-stranded DNA-specific DHH superfamily exonuclease
MERLEPFGKGFASPLFLTRGLTLLKDPRSMTEGRHASLELEKDGQSVRAVGFSLGDRLLHLHAGDCVDLVFQAVRNEFRGRVTVDWHIQDFRTTTS